MKRIVARANYIATQKYDLVYDEDPTLRDRYYRVMQWTSKRAGKSGYIGALIDAKRSLD